MSEDSTIRPLPENTGPPSKPKYLPPAIWIPVLFGALLVSGYFVLAFSSSWWPFTGGLKPIICSSEGRACPDGSVVGRTGPNCEFAACPEVIDPTADGSTSLPQDWQTYRNEEYGFEVKYPEDYNLEEAGGAHALVVMFMDGTDIISTLRIDPLSGYEGEELISQEAKIINGIPMTRQSLMDVYEKSKVVNYQFTHNSHEFLFRSRTAGTDEIQAREFDRILSTFKFIK